MYRLPFAISLEKSNNLIKAIEKDFSLDQKEFILAKKLLKSGLPPLVRSNNILSFWYIIQSYFIYVPNT